MMSKRKFHRTVIEVVVLSEEPFGYDDLADVDEAITNGACVGSFDTKSTTELTGKEAADALTAVHSEPGFFQLDDDGEDVED